MISGLGFGLWVSDQRIAVTGDLNCFARPGTGLHLSQVAGCTWAELDNTSVSARLRQLKCERTCW